MCVHVLTWEQGQYMYVCTCINLGMRLVHVYMAVRGVLCSPCVYSAPCLFYLTADLHVMRRVSGLVGRMSQLPLVLVEITSGSGSSSSHGRQRHMGLKKKGIAIMNQHNTEMANTSKNHLNVRKCTTVNWKNFVVGEFLYSSQTTKIECAKYFPFTFAV